LNRPGATSQWTRQLVEQHDEEHHQIAVMPCCERPPPPRGVATDAVYASVPAVDSGGVTIDPVFYIGRESLVKCLPMKSDKQFVNTLEDIIRKYGAMDKLISSAKVEISARVKDVMRAMVIDDWRSRTHYQHQEF
jgi:hypothetical protein